MPSTIAQCKKRIGLDGLHCVLAACVGGVMRQGRTMKKVDFEERGLEAISVFRRYLFLQGILIVIVWGATYLTNAFSLALSGSMSARYSLMVALFLFLFVQIALLFDLFRRTMRLGIACGNCSWRALLIKNIDDLAYLQKLNKCPKCRGAIVDDA